MARRGGGSSWFVGVFGTDSISRPSMLLGLGCLIRSGPPLKLSSTIAIIPHISIRCNTRQLNVARVVRSSETPTTYNYNDSLVTSLCASGDTLLWATVGNEVPLRVRLREIFDGDL